MRAMFRNIALLVVALGFSLGLSAQNLHSPYGYGSYAGGVQPRSFMEMGVLVGGSYMLSKSDAVELNPQLGIRAALAMSLCWDEAYALQMELGYIYNKIDANLAGVSPSKQSVKCGVFEIPLLFSYRGLGPIRLNVGPVLSLAGTARYDLPDERIEFGRVRPTLALAAGVGVELSKHLLLEARYTSGFASMSNYFEGVEFKSKSHWLAFNLGYMF